MITKIELFRSKIALIEPFVIAIGTQSHTDTLIIKIHTNDNLVGTGEVSPIFVLQGETQFTMFEIAKIISKYLIGKDPFELEQRISEIEKLCPFNFAVKSGFDMALYDLISKKADMPLYKFLGGSNKKELVIDKTIVIDEPEVMAKKAKQLVDEGITELKIKLGNNYRKDISRIKKIRETIGENFPLKIDANQGWTENDAMFVLNNIKQYNIKYAEQPVHKDNILALSKISSSSPIPIMADESLFGVNDAIELVRLRACNFFNIKLSKSGGIFNANKIAAIASAAAIPCQVGCMLETRFALTALAHYASAHNIITEYDIDSNFLLSEDPVLNGIAFIENKKWILPEGPGIGADFRPEFLNQSEKTTIK